MHIGRAVNSNSLSTLKREKWKYSEQLSTGGERRTKEEAAATITKRMEEKYSLIEVETFDAIQKINERKFQKLRIFRNLNFYRICGSSSCCCCCYYGLSSFFILFGRSISSLVRFTFHHLSFRLKNALSLPTKDLCGSLSLNLHPL